MASSPCCRSALLMKICDRKSFKHKRAATIIAARFVMYTSPSFFLYRIAHHRHENERKILYKRCSEKRDICCRGMGRFTTPHAGMTNAARGVGNFPTRRCPTLHAENAPILCAIYRHSVITQYRFNTSSQNASSQTLDFRGFADSVGHNERGA